MILTFRLINQKYFNLIQKYRWKFLGRDRNLPEWVKEFELRLLNIYMVSHGSWWWAAKLKNDTVRSRISFWEKMQNMMALVFLLRKHLGSQMLRAGHLVRGDSSNLGHGCIPSMCIECWPCTTLCYCWKYSSGTFSHTRNPYYVPGRFQGLVRCWGYHSAQISKNSLTKMFALMAHSRRRTYFKM